MTTGIATIYLAYQIYFDWLRATHLPSTRQLVWTMLHFPFHLALTLFVEGASQFMIWWKIMESLNHLIDVFNSQDSGDNFTSGLRRTPDQIVNYWNASVTEIFQQYDPPYLRTQQDLDHIFADVKNTTIPPAYYNATAATIAATPELQQVFDRFSQLAEQLVATVASSLCASFKIDPFKDGEITLDGPAGELQAEDQIDQRFTVVVSKERRWQPYGCA